MASPSTVPQSVRDSLADAEQLRSVTMDLVASGWRTADVDETFHVLGQCAVARAHLAAGHVHMARQTYIAATRAIHGMFPTLRDEASQ